MVSVGDAGEGGIRRIMVRVRVEGAATMGSNQIDQGAVGIRDDVQSMLATDVFCFKSAREAAGQQRRQQQQQQQHQQQQPQQPQQQQQQQQIQQHKQIQQQRKLGLAGKESKEEQQLVPFRYSLSHFPFILSLSLTHTRTDT